MIHPRKLFTAWLLIIAWLLCSSLYSQTIVGKITNEFNEPLPFANVFVKQLATGTISDDEGAYALRLENDGEYDLVFSSLGYESKSIPVAFTSDTLRLNVQLFTSGVDLQEITVNASKKDPAFGIIRKVIEHKKAHLRATESYRAKVYVKATEEIDRKKKAKQETSQVQISAGQPGVDPFEAQQQANQELLGRLNMVEMEVQLNYQYPNRYKE
ncbi:MAG: carboxypeptidase-like regulatory domain-containing protein, partial [Bacteroidota bacterium]